MKNTTVESLDPTHYEWDAEVVREEDIEIKTKGVNNMENKTLESALEEIKQMGNYAIDVRYGEDIGADDLDVSMDDRTIKISAFPVGCLGSARTLFVGSMDNVRKQNFKLSSYRLVSNPPTREEIKEFGYYIWGTEGAIETLREKLEII